MSTGARSPEELETLLEDAFVLDDAAALARLFEPTAVLVVAGEGSRRAHGPCGDRPPRAGAVGRWPRLPGRAAAGRAGARLRRRRRRGRRPRRPPPPREGVAIRTVRPVLDVPTEGAPDARDDRHDDAGPGAGGGRRPALPRRRRPVGDEPPGIRHRALAPRGWTAPGAWAWWSSTPPRRQARPPPGRSAPVLTAPGPGTSTAWRCSSRLPAPSCAPVSISRPAVRRICEGTEHATSRRDERHDHDHRDQDHRPDRARDAGARQATTRGEPSPSGRCRC